MSKYSFPDKITEHVITLTNGAKMRLLVSASETFGKALARANINPDDVTCVGLSTGPIWYEPDYAIASR
jgi:hypothetical protein